MSSSALCPPLLATTRAAAVATAQAASTVDSADALPCAPTTPAKTLRSVSRDSPGLRTALAARSKPRARGNQSTAAHNSVVAEGSAHSPAHVPAAAGDEEWAVLSAPAACSPEHAAVGASLAVPAPLVEPPSSQTGRGGRARSRATSKSTAGSAGEGAAAVKRRRAPVGQTGVPRGVPDKLGDAPLRLIVVGHNPSAHAWHSGHYYSNPSNRMWPILIKTGIAFAGATGCEADDLMPSRAGVGFTDVGHGQPGTDSSQFSSACFLAWREGFYKRLCEQTRRASASIGCVCGECGAPAFVAFSGKRQFLELLNVGLSGRHRTASVAVGPQAQLPALWPLPPRTAVWVCTSTSGASALSHAERERPWRALAQELQRVTWPRQLRPACAGQGPPVAGGATPRPELPERTGSAQ